MAEGILLVICGPSGVGKGTVCQALRHQYSNFYLSISATTRKPRITEVDGRHYYFLTKAQFQDMIVKEKFLEWAEVHEHLYGTPEEPVIAALKRGQDVLLEIDVQGALQVKDNFSDAVLAFILPPNNIELENRIRKRGTESEEEIQKRLRNAKAEMTMVKKFDYAIINDDVVTSCERLLAIMKAEKCRVKRLDLKELDGHVD